MKTLWGILIGVVTGAVAAGAADWAAELEGSWNSEYIFRGRQYAEDIYVPYGQLSVGGAYASIWAAIPDKSEDSSEIDYTIGYSFDVRDKLSLDAGATYYTYPEDQDDFFDRDVNTFEPYVGAAVDCPGAPSLYAFYDVDLEDFAVEATTEYEQELRGSLSVVPSLTAGYVDIGKSENYAGAEFDEETGDVIARGEGSYFYYGVGLDLVVGLLDSLSASAGARWVGSSEDGLYDGDDDTVWYAVTLSYGYESGGE